MPLRQCRTHTGISPSVSTAMYARLDLKLGYFRKVLPILYYEIYGVLIDCSSCCQFPENRSNVHYEARGATNRRARTASRTARPAAQKAAGGPCPLDSLLGDPPELRHLARKTRFDTIDTHLLPWFRGVETNWYIGSNTSVSRSCPLLFMFQGQQKLALS